MSVRTPCFILQMKNALRRVMPVAALCTGLGLMNGCAPPKGTLFYGTLAKGNPALIIASGSAATGAYAIVAYDTSGNYIETLADLNLVNLQPKGVAIMDAFDVIAPLSGGTYTLNKFNLFNGYSTYVNNANLTTTLYQMGYYSGGLGVYFVLKGGTTVEGFDSSGNRLGSTNAAIPATVGTSPVCTLATAYSMTIDSVNNRLFALNNTANTLNVYDLTNINSIACKSVNTTIPTGALAMGVTVHPNGYLYLGSQTVNNNRIFALNADGTGTATAVYTDTAGAILKTPTAMTVLPDGTVLVASSGTKEIDRFTVNGNSAWVRVGDAPFLHDTFSAYVNDMTIMKGL